MGKRILDRMTINTWRKDRFGAISFAAFISISVMLFSLTILLFTNLTGAIERLMNIAKTPDFLQMHTGDLDYEELKKFALERNEIKEWQVMGFLNLENTSISLGKRSLQDSTQDNGLSVQGEKFDQLLDLNDQIPSVKEGEVYVPVCYQSQYDVKVGDNMYIGEECLYIAGFIRDAQMNSMMASSKRFLVNKNDYERLRAVGQVEYLIEYLLMPDSNVSAFQTAYENAGLPMNGPTITRPLIKLMNTLSDGVMILIILLISVLVLIISLICIRFMLLTKVEEEKKELGILKAVGISQKDIRSMFLRRYMILSFVGAVIGIIISFIVYIPLSKQLQKLYSVPKNQVICSLISVVGALLLMFIIILFVKRILRKINKMTALEAVTGKWKEHKRVNTKVCMIAVLIFGVFLMIIPANLYSTMSSPNFASYMGIGSGEIRIDIRKSFDDKEKLEKTVTYLSQDQEVDEFDIYQTSSIPVTINQGETINVLVEQGEHSHFPVSYSKGKAPVDAGELAISYLLSKELGIGVGDTLRLPNDEYRYTITGVYSDITNGGKTAKISQGGRLSTEDVMWSIIYITLKPGTNIQNWLQQYQEIGVKAVDIKAYIHGTLGQMLSNIHKVSILAKVICAIVILLVISLFICLLVQKERNEISTRKALGFTGNSIRKAYATDSAKNCLIGGVLGILFGLLLGEKICGMILCLFGVDGFQFMIDPIQMILYIPLVSAVTVSIAIYLGTKKINKIDSIECLRGRE